ncbi:transposase, partial [Vibrio parahaemolyticus]|uniref:transposase n=1 Tax=Vibrio parahaemolyticus TaxID=670 RepID=UPI0011735509
VLSKQINHLKSCPKIGDHFFYKWIKAAQPLSRPKDENELLEAKKEILRLKGLLKQTEEERDILKKADVDSNGHCNSFTKILICIG